MIGTTRSTRPDAGTTNLTAVPVPVPAGQHARAAGRAALLAVMTLLFSAPRAAHAYPLDAADQTGISRLEAYYRATYRLTRPTILSSGALLPIKDIKLRLIDRPEFTLPAPDPTFAAEVVELLGDDAPYYGVAVLDITDPDAPRYAEHNGTKPQNPGSVGKILVALAWFQALADVYPDDIEARKRVMTDTIIVADEWTRTDHHEVPFWKPGDAMVEVRPIVEGDSGNIYTWLDWMLSASNNAAAGLMMWQTMLLAHFGTEYPVTKAQADQWFKEAPRSELTRVYTAAIQGSVTRNGLDLKSLRQGSFFTREGKNRIPGQTYSYATARELVRYTVQMEKGQLVDPFSSLEIKRLLYLTDRRIRYASSPALNDAAVFYKSGSLYSCKQEAGFACGKYMGNVKNYLNSLAIIETHDRWPQLDYITALLSNVLRKNSAVIHQQFGTDLHELMGAAHPATEAPAPAADISGSGTDSASPPKGEESDSADSQPNDSRPPSRTRRSPWRR
jgi:hypothetical protein